MSATSEYGKLKEAILNEIQDNYDLGKVKLVFAAHINSKRSLGRVESLENVFELLEQLDIINCNEVTALHYLGKELENVKVINLVNGYRKLYVESITCPFCEESTAFSPIVPSRCNKTEDESLLRVMTNLAENIGSKWRTLASELDLPENYIDMVREKYPSNFTQQALAALQVWKKLNEDTATIQVLEQALQARLCKRQGIGLHMLKTPIDVE